VYDTTESGLMVKKVNPRRKAGIYEFITDRQ
jgi:hypothetical protein